MTNTNDFTKKKVNVLWQVLSILIPFLWLIAFYRIQKLKKGLLLTGILTALIIIESTFIYQDSTFLLILLITCIIVIGLIGYSIIRWSKKYNQFNDLIDDKREPSINEPKKNPNSPLLENKKETYLNEINSLTWLGNVNEIFSKISKIIHNHYQDKFEINGEMTDNELLQFLQNKNISEYHQFKKLISLSILVKYASYKPTTEECNNVLDIARSIILDKSTNTSNTYGIFKNKRI